MFAKKHSNRQKEDVLEEEDPLPETKIRHIEGNLLELESDFTVQMETPKHLIYAFCSSKPQNSQVILYTFEKTQGTYEQLQVTGIQGVIVVAEFGYRYEPQDHMKVELILVLGMKNGFLKMISFQGENVRERRASMDLLRVESRQIRQLLFPISEQFQNVCIVLVDDCSIIFVNHQTKCIFARFCPNIVRIPSMALSMGLHDSENFIFQASKDGFLLFWDFSQEDKNARKESQKVKKVLSFDRAIEVDLTNSTEKMGAEVATQFYENQPCMRSRDIVYRLLPTYVVRPAELKGLRWIQLVKNLIYLINQEGQFKIIALNLGLKELKQEFIVIFCISIPDGSLINSVALNAAKQYLLVSMKSPHKAAKSVLDHHNKFQQKQHQARHNMLQRLEWDNYLHLTHMEKLIFPQIKEIDQILCNTSFEFFLLHSKSHFLVDIWH